MSVPTLRELTDRMVIARNSEARAWAVVRSTEDRERAEAVAAAAGLALADLYGAFAFYEAAVAWAEAELLRRVCHERWVDSRSVADCEDWENANEACAAALKEFLALRSQIGGGVQDHMGGSANG